MFKPWTYEALLTILQWLRSQFQGELFNALFFRVSPTVLNELPQIFVLSVAAAVTLDLNTNLPERLEWLKHVLSLLQPRHVSSSFSSS